MSMSIMPYIMAEMDPWIHGSQSSIINPIINRHIGYDPINPIIRKMMGIASPIEQQIGNIIHQNIDSSIAIPMPRIGKDGFQVSIDVGQFKPSEITIKAIEPNIVLIQGKHEERQDEIGSISREFSRKYILPKEYDPNSIISTLSSDGILTIKAPAPIIKESIERIIPIKEIGPAKASIISQQQQGKK